MITCPPSLPQHNAGASRARATLVQVPLNHSFDIDPDAHVLWGEWYLNLADSVHAKRLDTIGFRLMAILALTAAFWRPPPQPPSAAAQDCPPGC